MIKKLAQAIKGEELHFYPLETPSSLTPPQAAEISFFKLGMSKREIYDKLNKNPWVYPQGIFMPLFNASHELNSKLDGSSSRYRSSRN